jgi:hypothetical protein
VILGSLHQKTSLIILSLTMVSIASQFSTGEQSTLIRERFWNSGFSRCQNVLCSVDNKNEKTIQSVSHPAGCRFNGDGYGTDVFSCSACGWSTSFQYDEASEPYYYETRFFKRKTSPSPPPHPWASIQVQKWMHEKRIDPRVQSKLRGFAFDGPTLADMSQQQFMALGLKEDEAKSVVVAIGETMLDLEQA